jgi:deazaflavin-dependent oxidoreductase (nitroreductase family)
VLTTRGRKSGLARHAILEYRRHGSKLYLVSAWGIQPHWYQNLIADPLVTVQMGTQEQKAVAHVVDNPGEALRALYMFQRTSPIYDLILASMSSADTIDLRTLKQVANEFTVIRLDLQTGTPPLGGVRPLNRWLGPLVLFLGVALMVWMVWARMTNDET